MLVILDGWGHREEKEHNAIYSARTPHWDRLWKHAPHTLLEASGEAVGLPAGQMGNSEVGHTVIGGGRIVLQDIARIDRAIEDGSFFDNAAYLGAIDAAVRKRATVHILGLLSPGGVHSHQRHIEAALRLAAKRGAVRICLHAFLDGRDTPPRSARESLAASAALCAELETAATRAHIASLCGRYYAMDRDRRWERTQKACQLLSEGTAEFHAADALQALQAAYERGESDEFVQPTLVGPAEPAVIRDGDAVLCMNFRPDRMRQLCRALLHEEFTDFPRPVHPHIERDSFVCTTRYAEDLETACAFPRQPLRNTLGEIVANRGMRQLRMAETEKYAHVSFFFSGGREECFPGETRKTVPSPRVATYDLQPEMSAPELSAGLVEAIRSGEYELIVCNYANGDMVGHTGVFAAAVKAVEAVDHSLGQLLAALDAAGGECLITADHGNCEMMDNPDTQQAHTAHTCQQVPLVYAGARKPRFISQGSLADIAPTMLRLLGMEIPAEMNGKPLLELP